MLTAKAIIERVRMNTYDKQETGFTDEMLLGYINDGIRLLRRTILDVNPDLLADYDYITTLKAGENRVNLVESSVNVTLSRVVDVRIDGHTVYQEDKRRIVDTTKEGEPFCYYMLGQSTISVYPVPPEDMNVEVTGVKDQKLLTSIEEKTPLPSDVDDFLIEFVGIRAKMTDEFDLTQENSLFSSIIRQVENYAMNLLPSGITVDGVWDRPRIRRDYGRVEIL